MNPGISVQIDALVLEGFNPQHAERLSAALQSELQRLIEERGLPQGLPKDIPELVLDHSVELRQGMPPEAMGALAAQALYAGWEK